MKRWSYLFFIIFIMLLSWDSVKGEVIQTPLIPDDAIRLRIIANSDEVHDQVLKHQVRDRVIELITPKVALLTDYNKAKKIIESDLPSIENSIKELVSTAGYDYQVKVELRKVPFPTKMYGGVVYPAGEYEALRITLGEGLGENWWCVLFPPLCFVDIDNSAPVATTNQIDRSSDQPIEVKFFIVELINKIISLFN